MYIYKRAFVYVHKLPLFQVVYLPLDTISYVCLMLNEFHLSTTLLNYYY